jgi:two-component system sensor histidine kinase KdpD
MTVIAAPTPSRPASPWLAFGTTVAAVAVATLAAVLVDAASGAPNASLVFVLPVVFAAASFGWGPALVAAVAGATAYNFFLIEPRGTFHVADPSNAWALLLLLITAGVVSVIAEQSRRRALAAQTAADQATALQSLARTLVGATSRQAIADCCAEAVSRLFRAPAVVLLEERQTFTARGEAGGAALSPADEDAARWALAARHASRGGAYPAGDADFDFWPVVTRARQAAVIGVRLRDPDAGRPEAPERLVEIVEGYLSVALDREAYSQRALDRRVQSAGEQLKADLLAAVSHDLKTPLSTILFTLQSLRKFDQNHDRQTRAELLESAEAEAARLNRMVENLLDMSRVEADAVTVQAAPTDPSDLVSAAIARASLALVGRRVVNAAAGGASALLVDAGLFETALANLLENAGKYSPEGSIVRIEAGEEHGMGWIEVVDEGPGFDRAPEALFEKFVRGQEGDGRPPGTGLGLSIARSFVEAQGGRIEAFNREDGKGARVRLLAPLARAAAA